MQILLSLLESVVFGFIIYKCFEKFDYKITWAICEVLLLVIYVIAVVFLHRYINFFTFLISSLIGSGIGLLILYKVYEKTDSFITFMILSIIIGSIISFIW